MGRESSKQKWSVDWRPRGSRWSQRINRSWPPSAKPGGGETLGKPHDILTVLTCPERRCLVSTLHQSSLSLLISRTLMSRCDPSLHLSIKLVLKIWLFIVSVMIRSGVSMHRPVDIVHCNVVSISVTVTTSKPSPSQLSTALTVSWSYCSHSQPIGILQELLFLLNHLAARATKMLNGDCSV